MPGGSDDPSVGGGVEVEGGGVGVTGSVGAGLLGAGVVGAGAGVLGAGLDGAGVDAPGVDDPLSGVECESCGPAGRDRTTAPVGPTLTTGAAPGRPPTVAAPEPAGVAARSTDSGCTAAAGN